MARSGDIRPKHRAAMIGLPTTEITMHQDDIKLVRDTLPAVVAIADQAAALFYERLFLIDPSTRPLFARTDMAAQGAKLMAAIATVVGALDDLDAVRADLGELAARHSVYGVEAQHYASVGTALLWTLEQGLGGSFTPQVKAAWANAYGAICGAMLPWAQAA
jgi:nitric oxide dioxygenase